MLNGRYDRLGWLPCVCYYYGTPVIVWATSLALIFEFYVITIYVTYANIYIYIYILKLGSINTSIIVMIRVYFIFLASGLLKVDRPFRLPKTSRG